MVFRFFFRTRICDRKLLDCGIDFRVFKFIILFYKYMYIYIIVYIYLFISFLANTIGNTLDLFPAASRDYFCEMINTYILRNVRDMSDE